MTLGEKIINEIVRQPMLKMVCHESPESPVMAIWNANAADQIEALIQRHPVIGVKELWDAMPRDVQRKISLHDLKRIADNLSSENAEPSHGSTSGS